MAANARRARKLRLNPAYFPGGAVATDPNVTSINAEGWTAEYVTPPTFDPINTPKYVVVQRQGFTAAGVPTVVTDAVTIMARKRLPYPSQASLAATTVVLSDEVYATDRIFGVPNKSTLVAPKPIAAWVTPDLERTRTASFVARLAVTHAFARSGSPVAAVRFIASDGTNTSSVLVTAQSSRQFASGLYAPYYEATIDTSGLTAGAICTVDAIIYPWVGAAYQISVDGSQYPSMNLCPLAFLNDRSGSYGEAFAYVDATLGNDGTGVVSATAATAAAAPYLTVAAASTAIRAFNNTNYARNQVGGGTIRLQTGTYTHADFSAAGSATAFPLVMEAVGARASTIYRDAGAHTFSSWPKKCWVRNITLQKTVTTAVFMSNGALGMTSANMLKLEGCLIDQNSQADYNAWIDDVGRLYLYETDCPTALTAFHRTSTDAKWLNAVGCTGLWGMTASNTATYNIIACKLAAAGRVTGNAGMETAVGCLISHSVFSQGTNGNVIIDADSNTPLGPRGFGIVGCVLEQYGGITGPALELWDGTSAAVENVVLMGLTVVGSRTNVLYNDVAYSIRRGRMRFSINFADNIKSDVFGTNGAYVGNWAARYQVGFLSNAYLTGSTNGGGVGSASWMGEVAALGDLSGTTTTALTLAFTNDASFSGTKLGGGDYKPTTPSQVPKIPAGLAPYSIDLNGVTVANDGTGLSGAIQVAASTTVSTAITGSGVFIALGASGGSAAGVSVLSGKAASGLEIAASGVFAPLGAASTGTTGGGIVAGAGASSSGAAGASVLSGGAALISAMVGAATLAGLPAYAAGVIGSGSLAGLGAAASSVTGAASLVQRSASGVATSGAGVLAGAGAASASIAGASVLSDRSAASSASAGTSLLAGIAAGGGSIGAIVGQGSLSGISAAIGAIQGQAVLSGATAGLSGILGASALAGLGAASSALVGGAILAGISTDGTAIIDTPDVARPGAYRRITAPGTYRLITRPGHWRAAN